MGLLSAGCLSLKSNHACEHSCANAHVKCQWRFFSVIVIKWSVGYNDVKPEKKSQKLQIVWRETKIPFSLYLVTGLVTWNKALEKSSHSFFIDFKEPFD